MAKFDVTISFEVEKELFIEPTVKNKLNEAQKSNISDSCKKPVLTENGFDNHTANMHTKKSPGWEVTGLQKRESYRPMIGDEDDVLNNYDARGVVYNNVHELEAHEPTTLELDKAEFMKTDRNLQIKHRFRKWKAKYLDMNNIDMLNWANNEKGDSDGKTIESDVNNARNESETETEMINLTLKVDSNLSEARSKKKIIYLKNTNGSEQFRRMERVSYRLNSSLISTNKDEMSPSSNDIEFVGLNAENGDEMGTLFPYLRKDSNYFDIQKGSHQESAEKILKSVPTEITGQDVEIREVRRSCNNLWMHYELKCTYTVIKNGRI